MMLSSKTSARRLLLMIGAAITLVSSSLSAAEIYDEQKEVGTFGGGLYDAQAQEQFRTLRRSPDGHNGIAQYDGDVVRDEDLMVDIDVDVGATDELDLLETKERKLSKGNKNNPAVVPQLIGIMNSGLQKCIDKLIGVYTYVCCCEGGIYQATIDCDGPYCSYDESEISSSTCPAIAETKEKSDCKFSGSFDAREVINPSTCDMKNEDDFIKASYGNDHTKCTNFYNEGIALGQQKETIGFRFKHGGNGDLELTFIRADVAPKQAEFTAEIGQRRVTAVLYSTNTENGRFLESGISSEEKNELMRAHRELEKCDLGCRSKGKYDHGHWGYSNIGLLNKYTSATYGCKPTSDPMDTTFCQGSGINVYDDADEPTFDKKCVVSRVPTFIKGKDPNTLPRLEVTDVNFDCCNNELYNFTNITDYKGFQRTTFKNDIDCKIFINSFCIKAPVAKFNEGLLQGILVPYCNGCETDNDCMADYSGEKEGMKCLGRKKDAGVSYSGRQFSKCVDLNRCMGPAPLPLEFLEMTQCKTDWRDGAGNEFSLEDKEAGKCCGKKACLRAYARNDNYQSPPLSESCKPSCITKETSCRDWYSYGFSRYRVPCNLGQARTGTDGWGNPLFGEPTGDILPLWKDIAGYERPASCNGQDAMCADNLDNDDLATKDGVACSYKTP